MHFDCNKNSKNMGLRLFVGSNVVWQNLRRGQMGVVAGFLCAVRGN